MKLKWKEYKDKKNKKDFVKKMKCKLHKNKLKKEKENKNFKNKEWSNSLEQIWCKDLQKNKNYNRWHNKKRRMKEVEYKK